MGREGARVAGGLVDQVPVEWRANSPFLLNPKHGRHGSLTVGPEDGTDDPLTNTNKCIYHSSMNPKLRIHNNLAEQQLYYI